MSANLHFHKIKVKPQLELQNINNIDNGKQKIFNTFATLLTLIKL